MRLPARLALLPVAVLLGGLVVVAPDARAEGVCTRDIFGPSDPRYANAERNPQDPRFSFNTEQWYLFDCIPQSAPLARDPEGAAGMSVNRAWQEHGYGSDEVLVAYLEGGVNWRRADTAPELRRRAFLNTAELPLPQRADGTTGTAYDLDGDGIETVDDWAADPRIGPLLHADTAGGITAEDLIVAFSDGTDADGNGYVDDISGWNFHRDTNDPQTDQSIYNHANAEQAVILGERDNGIGGTGMCPSCRLLSVKTGDESIDRTDRTAQGIVFAVDAGADVIAGVVVTLGETKALGEAFRYAYDNGVVVTWASNDFESADHTEGMLYDHLWPGNAVISDQTNRLGQALPNDRLARTFRSRSGVTSYGPHNLFSVASTNGSTSFAVPTQAGVAALVKSAGVAAADRIGGRLDADEVKQVVRATASDIDATPPSTVGQPFPAQPGFDIQYGYGRPNVAKAVAAVHAGDVPPTVDIVSPRWYQMADPTVQDALRIEANVAARRSSSYTYAVQFGLGPQPLEGEFVTVATGRGTAAQHVVHDLDLTRIPESFWRGQYEITADRLSIERYDVTVRVQVTDAQGRLGEDRKAALVRHDDGQLPGFPLELGQGLEPSPTVADLDGDGALEIVQPSSDGVVHVLRADGTPLPGFPVRTLTAPGFDGSNGVSYLGTPAWQSGLTQPGDGISNAAAVGDLDHDGGLDIVVSTTNGRVYAWDGAGRLRPGFPVRTDPRFARQSVPVPDTPYTRNATAGAFGAPVLGDLDGDDRLEVVLGGWDGQVYAWRPDGSLLPGWPASTENPDKTVPSGFVYARDFKVATTPTLADVDGDGRDDVLVALQDTTFPEESNEGPTTGFLTGFSSDGQRLPGYPVRVPGIIQGYGTAQDFITEGVQTPAVFDGPTGPQMMLNMGLAQANLLDLRTRQLRPLAQPQFAQEGRLQAATPLVHFTTSASLGRLVPGSPLPQAAQSGSAVADIALAVAATPGLGVKVRSGLTAYDLAAGAPLPAFATPKALQGLPFLTAPAIADVSGDGLPDLVVGTDSVSLHAFDGRTGDVLPGFPKHTGGWTIYTPAIADVDGDGKVEVFASTREGYLHAWRTEGLAEGNTEAWHYHQDDRNTGHYGTDTRPPSGVADLVVTRDGDADVLAFTSPGDDWGVGTPARYEVFRSGAPLSQDGLAAAKSVPVDAAPVAAGREVALRVPAVDGVHYAVRAVDDAGNLGPVRLRAVPATAAVSPAAAPAAAPAQAVGQAFGAQGTRAAVVGGRLPATGAVPLLPVAGAVALLAAAAFRRRRAR